MPRACPNCDEEFDDKRCGPCQAEELFNAFLEAMPEVSFAIGADFGAEQQIVAESYGGDARAYFLQSWGNFLVGQ